MGTQWRDSGWYRLGAGRAFTQTAAPAQRPKKTAFHHIRENLRLQAIGDKKQENCKVRGLVHFSAERLSIAARTLAENMDLSPLRSTLQFSCGKKVGGRPAADYTGAVVDCA
jgi:hypothetical protein